MKLSEIVSANEKDAAPTAAQRTGGVVVDFIRKPLADAFAGLNEDAREERSAEEEKAIDRRLQSLEIDKELQDKLRLRLEEQGCELRRDEAEHPYGGKRIYKFSALLCRGKTLALAQVPPAVFATDQDGDDLYLSRFTHMLKAFRGTTLRVFSTGKEGMAYGFKTALKDEGQGADWQFVAWPDVVSLLNGKLEFWQVFSVERLRAPEARPAIEWKPINDVQRKTIVDVLARYALDYNPPETAFRGLVNESNWPGTWKTLRLGRWTNNPEADASELFEFMRNRAAFPHDHEWAGCNVLGEFLRLLLQKDQLGGPDAASLARIVVDCTLVPDVGTFKKYYS